MNRSRSIPLVVATVVSFACFAGRAQAVARADLADRPAASRVALEHGQRLQLELALADPLGVQPTRLAVAASWQDDTGSHGHVGVTIVIIVLFVAVVALSLFLVLSMAPDTR